MSNKPFQKFIDKPLAGAKKKEVLRREKRLAKQEARALKESKKANRNWEPGMKKEEIGNWKSGMKKEDQQKNIRADKPHFKNKQLQSKNDKQKIVSDKPQNSNFKPQTSSTQMPLNKYIAHAGICGRREAAELVKSGKAKVNNEIIYEPGYKVRSDDVVHVNGKKIFLQKNLVYVLLNKPKDYITTSDDPQGRKTVMDLIKHATTERVYPVGRLDRNTTGVLLLTNDGELTQKLSHPSFEIKKLYEATLDKPLSKKDFEAMIKGITLDDGFIKADALAYADPKDKTVIGVEIHSGRNRIVRRMFEHLGYDVKNLDRVMFANLTKKNVERGKWRLLKEKEIRLLKYMNQSFVRHKKNE